MESYEGTSYFSHGNVSSDDNPENKFIVLKEIEKLQDDDVKKVAKVLSVSKTLACSLLMQHKWRVDSVLESTDLSDHREPVRTKSEKNSCQICFEESNPNLEFISLACSHLFCVKCWESYISVSIRDGPGCLTLTCPEPECKVTVRSEVIDGLTSPEDRNKYYSYVKRSYVEDCKKRKWCPGPGCEFAVELRQVRSKNFEVTCDCSYKFCFNCGEESHRPLNCVAVRKWAEKDISGVGNSRWIMACTKSCPKCNRSIEKNQGCNLMTCEKPCGHRFCWLCLEPARCHLSCNGYEESNVTDTARMKARAEIKRYMHYYERYDSNRKSRIRAMSDLDHAREEQLPLSDLLCVTEAALKFVIEAWEQIIECRRVLRWSYAKAYFLSVNKDEHRKYFEFRQGQAEYVLEKLHHCVEMELDEIKCDSSTFSDFRMKVIGLTRVTGNHFGEFIKALEDDNFCGPRK